MSLEYVTDHEQEAHGLLIEQFKEAANFKAWISSYMTQVQDLENVFFDLLLLFSIDDSDGVQLDTIGAIVGRDRRGEVDELFRLYLKAHIKANVSSGEPEALIAIVGLVGATSFAYREYYPAAWSMIISEVLDYDIGQVLAEILFLAKVGGVRSVTEWTEHDTAFGWFGDATGDGFHEGAWFNADRGDAVRPQAAVDWQFIERASVGTATQDMNDIAHDGADRYVGVGDGGEILFSNDGLFWYEATSGTAAGLVGADHGDGTFVVVAVTGAILKSSDGESWSSPGGALLALRSVAYDGDGLWCAVGDGDGANDATILTSTDTTTWTPRTSGGPVNVDLLDVAHDGDGLWCAVGEADLCLTSPDGVTWTSRTIPGAAQDLHGVVYDQINSQWVVCGDGGKICTSPDGITWTEQTSGSAEDLLGIGHDGVGTLVCCGTNGEVLSSTDGVSWASRTSGVATDLNRLIWNSRYTWHIMGDGPTYLTATRRI